jgi:hypothetical protein
LNLVVAAMTLMPGNKYWVESSRKPTDQGPVEHVSLGNKIGVEDCHHYGDVDPTDVVHDVESGWSVTGRTSHFDLHPKAP